jgi:hypothetical protein
MPNEELKGAFRENFDELMSIPDEITSDESIDDLVEASPEKSYPTRYQNIKGIAERKAKKTIDSLLKFYLSENIIEQHDYIKAKAEIDKASLSTLIYQMQTTEKAITTLLDNIDNGDMTPRMFEVLGNLQKTLLDIVKSQTMYLMASEESLKKISRDIEIYNPGTTSVTPSSGSSGIKSRGTKDLMKALRGLDTKVEEAEEINQWESNVQESEIDNIDTGLHEEEDFFD